MALEIAEIIGLAVAGAASVSGGVGLVWKFMTNTFSKQAEHHFALVRSVQEDTKAARLEAQVSRTEFTDALKEIGARHEAAIGKSMTTLERVESDCARQRDADRALILKLARISGTRAASALGAPTPPPGEIE